jgi:hypothetical protein
MAKNLAAKKRKVLKDLPSTTHLKSKNSRLKKSITTFLTDSELEDTNSVSAVKCFRPKNINEGNKAKLLKLICRKTERSVEKMQRLNKTAKNSLGWQFDSLVSLRGKLEEQRRTELMGLHMFEHALDEIEMQILLVPSK